MCGQRQLLRLKENKKEERAECDYVADARQIKEICKFLMSGEIFGESLPIIL